MSTKRKTTAKKAAKRAPTKAAQAFSKALETLKKPESPVTIAHIGSEPPVDDFDPIPEQAGSWEAVPNYGPPTDVDEEALARELLLGTPAVSDAPAGFSKEFEIPSGHIVPQTPLDAPQVPLDSEKLGQTPEPETEGFPSDMHVQVANCIENLIDGLNFAHSKGMLRKMQERDLQIIKARIKRGRELVAQLRA